MAAGADRATFTRALADILLGYAVVLTRRTRTWPFLPRTP
jgi:hypothetical protein